MAIKTIDQYGLISPVTTDPMIEAAFGQTLASMNDAANKALNALSDEIDNIRRSRNFTSAGKDAAAVAAARQTLVEIENATTGGRKLIAAAIERAAKAVPTEVSLPLPDNIWTKGDPAIVAQRSAEIRSTLAAMEPTMRGATFTVGVSQQDHELVYAIVSAPRVVRAQLFPDAGGLSKTIGAYLEARYPQEFASLNTAKNADVIARGILGTAREAAKSLCGAPARFDGPDPSELPAMLDAATKPLRLDPLSGKYEPLADPATAAA